MRLDPSEYRGGFEELPSATVLLDDEGRVVRANRAARTLLGVEESDVEATPLVEVLTTGSTGEETTLRRTIRRACTGDVAAEVHPEEVHADVGSTPVSIRARSVRGETVAAVVQIADRDRRTQGRDTLKQYETVVSTLPDAVFATDGSGYLTYANPSFERLTGHSLERIRTGQLHLSELLTESATETMQAELRERMAAEAAPGRVIHELAVIDVEDRRIPVRAVIDDVPSGDRFQGIVGMLRDVSARRRRQEILSVMNRILRHNLRTHVNLITGNVEMVQPALDEERQGYLDRVIESAEWLRKLGRTLRELQEAVRQGRTEDTDATLESLIEEVVFDAREAYPAAEFEVRMEVDDQVEVGSALGYALENVVENAVVHNDDTPRVEVWVAEGTREGWFEILVSDDGPGIPDHERETVMSEAEITQLNHGSGIGLWITRWIVELLGGELAIAADGQGTTVSLSLPRSTHTGFGNR